jgi:hypothetical protein
MPKMSRRPTDRDQFWRDTITTWKESGQSIRAFCATHGIAEATFFVKRRELADRERPLQPTAPTPRPSFAAVRVIAEPVVEVVLPTGLLVRIPSAPPELQAAGRRAADAEAGLTRHRILEWMAELVRFDDRHRRVMMRNPGGDAIDAVIVAVGATLAVPAADHRAIARHARHPREGHLFV